MTSIFSRKLRFVSGIFLFFVIFSSKAQQIDTSFVRTRAKIPAHLKGIERAPGSSALGAVYYYGEQRLRSPFSLDVPFYEMADPEVTRHYRGFRTLNTISQLTALAPLAYLLFQEKGSQTRTREYWYFYLGSIAASLGLSIAGNVKVSKAVKRYNQVLLENRLGFSIAPLPGTGRAAVGLGWVGRFGTQSN
jgi:hypothetical protein